MSCGVYTMRVTAGAGASENVDSLVICGTCKEPCDREGRWRTRATCARGAATRLRRQRRDVHLRLWQLLAALQRAAASGVSGGGPRASRQHQQRDQKHVPSH